MHVLIETLVRSILLLALAWLVAALLRRGPASHRALVWTCALGGILALPILTAALPRWRLPLLPAIEAPASDASPSPAIAVAWQTDAAPPRVAHATAAPEPVASAASVAGTPRGVAGVGSAPRSAITLERALVFLWLLGSALLLLRLAASAMRAGALARAARAASPGWRATVEEVRHALDLRRPVESRVSDAVSVPAVTGILHPVLLLPPEAESWPAGLRRTVALHELAHVRRSDGLAQLLGHLACAAYWFLPLAWYAAHRAAEEREQACDDVVITAGTRVAEYAETLVRLVRAATGADLQPAALAMGRPSRLEERVMGILDPRRRHDGLRLRSALALGAGAVALVTLVAVVEPAAARVQGSGAAAPATTPVVVTGPIGPRASHPDGLGTPVVPIGQDSLCRGGKSSSSSINEDDDGHRRWTVKLRGDRCTAEFRLEGKIEFTDDFTDVKSISPGGFVRVEVTAEGVRREIEIVPRGGSLERTWKVDGQARPWDDSARAWFAAFLVELDRRTAVAADIRIPKLLARGGVPAVLAETGLMTSDWARTQYYRRLLQQRALTPDEIRRLVAQAAELGTSDFHSAELLAELGRRGALRDPANRASALVLLRKMDSDFHRAQVAASLLEAGPPTAAEVDALTEIAGLMRSDFHKASLLEQLLDRAPDNGAYRLAALRAATTIESDFHAAAVLSRLVARAPLNGAERNLVFDAIGRIESDFQAATVLEALLGGEPSPQDLEAIVRAAERLKSDYHRAQVLSGVVQHRSASADILLRVVEAGRSVGSDFHRAELLERVARHPAADDRVRAAVRQAAESLGGFHRGQVQQALGGREI